MKNKECYLCKGQNTTQRQGSVRDNPQLKILECDSCGLAFLSSFEHIKNDFYENSNMHTNETIDIKNWIKVTEADDERRFQYLKEIIPDKSLLDFGCGTGNFLVKASGLTDKVYGIEPETRLTEHFNKMNLKVFRSASEIPSKTKYDIITLFHVLEHILDPKVILVELSKLLKDKGQMIIEVPSANDALLTLYNCEAFSHFTYWSCHLFLFTVKTLKELASQVNLKINYIKQVQRYPLSNHLYWLSKGKPNGHKEWESLDSKEFSSAYEAQLAKLNKCDTILMSLSI